MAVRTLDIPALGRELLDCESCVERFEDGFRSLPGVISVQASSSTGLVSLTFDTDSVPLDILRQRADEIGEAIRRRYGHETYSIDGLNCADCARVITNAAKKAHGIVGANASFASSTLFVEYETGVADLDALKRDIEKLGYKVLPEPEVPGVLPVTPSSPLKNTRSLLTLLSALLLALGVATEFALHAETISTALYVASGLSVAGYVFRGAWSALKARTVETDFLMGIAALGAAYLGDWREAAAVLFLYTLGETLEAYTVSRARGAIRSLVESFPKQATILRDGAPHIVSTETIKPGDIALVRPGERSPVDGVIVEGSSELDESLVTGEALPVRRSAGDRVFAGSINGSGALQVRCEKAIEDNAVNRIIHLVEEAQSRKAPAQRISERFGQIYTPVVIVLAIGVAVAGPLVFSQPFSESFRKALILLTVSCPCALVLSAPVAVVSALASAARNGLLIKGGSVLESLGRVDTVCFDKTGTLTQARLEVAAVIPNDTVDEDELLAVAGAVESRSEHLIGRAVYSFAVEKGLKLPEASGFTALPGKGARATIDGCEYLVGSAAWLKQEGYNPHLQTPRDNNESAALYVGSQGRILGVILLTDTLRKEAPGVIQALKAIGISRSVLLTGDNSESAKSAAAAAGMDEWKSGLLPEEKLEFVSQRAAEGVVAMVGDGINDAPALARADVGIAIGGATDASAETADVLLMTSDLTRLPFSVQLGRQANSIIRMNLAFSVAIVVSLVILTLLGKVTLALGVIGHEASSLIVVANGMRLLRARPQKL